jgi:DNA-binding CsgD family transcriptional regulator
MRTEAVEKLTERERDCLRLVLVGYTTKEIARQIAVTDLRAQKIIESAIRKLGVSRRMEAARILAGHEGRGVGVAPGGSPTLPDTPSSPSILPQDDETRQPLTLREERSAFNAPARPPTWGCPVAAAGGQAMT